jgi:hypothetical protein
MGRASTLDELQSVVAKTCPAKTEADEADLLAEWWRRARAHGLTPPGSTGPSGRPGPRCSALGCAPGSNAAATAVTAERSIFTRGDLLAPLSI